MKIGDIVRITGGSWEGFLGEVVRFETPKLLAHLGDRPVVRLQEAYDQEIFLMPSSKYELLRPVRGK